MTHITQADVDLVKNRTNILSLVGASLQLKRIKEAYVGVCPFHDETKTRGWTTFHVNKRRKFYHCFECGASGDVFDFVQRIRGVGFDEAVDFLDKAYPAFERWRELPRRKRSGQ